MGVAATLPEFSEWTLLFMSMERFKFLASSPWREKQI